MNAIGKCTAGRVGAVKPCAGAFIRLVVGALSTSMVRRPHVHDRNGKVERLAERHGQVQYPRHITGHACPLGGSSAATTRQDVQDIGLRKGSTLLGRRAV